LCARGSGRAGVPGPSTSPLDVMDPFPEDYELAGFFEAEPEFKDRGGLSFHERLTFKTTRGEDQITCDIERGDHKLLVSWFRQGHSVGRFALSGVASLELTSSRGEEFMTAKFARAGLLEFRLYLKPRVQVQWGNVHDPDV